MNTRSPTRPALFEPLEIRAVTLPNRIVISPMCQYSAHDGLVNDWHFAHLAKFAVGGAGMVFVEATAVEARGRITHGDLGIWSDSHADALQRIVKFIQSQGSVAALQIGHAGSKASAQRPWHGKGPLADSDAARGEPPWDTVAASNVSAEPGAPAPHGLDVEEIDAMRDAFVAAARRANACGFDVLEVHGAHGFLLHSFLSPLTNRRNDAYGGDLQGRMRFVLEIIEAVRAVWPQGKPLFFRGSVVDGADDGWQIEDSIALAKELKVRGVDVVDCSTGGISTVHRSNRSAAAELPRPGFLVPFAERIRKEANIMTQAVGLIMKPQQAEAILRAGSADLIAIAREALNDPHWALHAAQELGADSGFDVWPEQYGWWLARRKFADEHVAFAAD